MESDGSIRINYGEYEHWKYDKFARFVNNMLLRRRNVDLHKFQLCFKGSHLINFKDVRTWIQYAVNHGVKVLDVNLGRYDKTDLPRCIFTCRSLEELNLQMGKAPYGELEHEGLILPDKICLPSLKKLNLCDVEVYTSSLQQIIDGSPGLEDVYLSNCAQHLELVESNMLKRLEIHGFFDRGEGLTISAPHLTHFECIGWPLEEISWQKRPSLEGAHINTRCSGRTFDGQSDLIGIVLHAKRLALCGSDIKVCLTHDKFPCFIAMNILNGNWLVCFFVYYFTWL